MFIIPIGVGVLIIAMGVSLREVHARDAEYCRELEAAVDQFLDDPITQAYGVGDEEFVGLIVDRHVAGCLKCQRNREAGII